MGSEGENVKVVVRCRPLNSREKAAGWFKNMACDKDLHQISLFKEADKKDLPKQYTFDSVYDDDSTQEEVYDESAFPIVESVLEGYNGTIFAYGQTGCGKTHTMTGTPDNKGIIPKAFDHIFGCIDAANDKKRFLVRCSYLEIYKEKIRDLLSQKKNLKYDIKEDPNKGIFVAGLTTVIVNSIPEIEKTMEAGYKNRSTAATKMNEHSSRSHSIFTIYIETSEEDEKLGETVFKAGKLHLVDLAGSEKQKQTQADHERLEEAKKINLSLSALGNVIKALVDGKSKHVPYRDSKLTRLLQDSLGGNTKTLMVAALSPSSDAYEESLSTLRYADRAKSIKNVPKINEDPKDALLREYEEEIKKLKKMIEQLSSGGSNPDTLSIQNAMKQMEKNFQGVMNNNHVEDSVDALVKRLEAQGKKFKIVYEDEVESEGEESEAKPNKKKPKKKKPAEREPSSEEPEEDEEIIDEVPPAQKPSKSLKADDSVDFSGPIKELEKLEQEK